MATPRASIYRQKMSPTTNYFFVKVDEAVPLKSSGFSFDAETLPSQAIATERFHLSFVAHSSGNLKI